MLMEVSILQNLIARSSRKKTGSIHKEEKLIEAAQKSIGKNRLATLTDIGFKYAWKK